MLHEVHQIWIGYINGTMKIWLNLWVLRLTPLLQQLLDVLCELAQDTHHAHWAIQMSQTLPQRSHDEEHVRPCQFNAHLETLHLLLKELKHLIRPFLHRITIQQHKAIPHESMTHLITEI